MKEADVLLERHPDVRIIHLIRDPRGTMLSRAHFTDKETGEMHKNYTSVCRRLLDDIQTSKAIAQKHAGRILTVRYEDLAQFPVAVTQKLYSFSELKYTPEVEKYVKKITSKEQLNDEGKPSRKSTSRKDPYRTAYNWRKEMSFQLIKKIDRACEGVYEAMGYRTFSDEDELRDMTVSAKIDDFRDHRILLRLLS
ncbi:carbohydrate sulfotransferase 4 [Aplysia californica]|uniref:Carbohydrate sulfotransferase 4 n=1 Tax=Aplysia californica TaxID=6500 RepID=A0ABM0ZY18_APLCA|nr:carbohydrate sulfotransferase 4 [Aplysia californica]